MTHEEELSKRVRAAWDDATNPDISDVQLSPQAKALRNTAMAQNALLHAHVRRMGAPRPLRRFFDWYPRGFLDWCERLLRQHHDAS